MTNQEQIKVYYHPVRNELYLIEQNDFFLILYHMIWEHGLDVKHAELLGKL